ncbi:sulfotransferase family protein [Hansschlegelia zhihuaiae]|uniref:Sulfotransferase family protein n=1 Tax=Hansschlegelia zhihuaiae TaxID=405005 RepID=A0A4Q0M2T9_9HYPH|nr:sulfotransferase [Hansschlegelia zhihuaiae]RXF67220.1 hypothetical protein EK403_21535 [Hansschlegelia zhihuaiae]
MSLGKCDAPTTQAADRAAAVVVLGMHRSGTSALSRSLSFFGFRQAASLLPAQADNPKGFWEARPVVRLNNRILRSVGSGWSDPAPWRVEGRSLAESRDFVAERLTEMWSAPARAALRSAYGTARSVVIKDPRICLLAPLWSAALSESYDAHFVFIHRNPVEVARSLNCRNGMDEARAARLWLRYALGALAAGPSVALASVLSYDELLRDPAAALSALVADIGREGTIAGKRLKELREFVSPSDRHHTAAPSELNEAGFLSPPVRETYDLLLRWRALTADARAEALAAIMAAYDAREMQDAPPALSPGLFGPPHEQSPTA